MKIVVVWLYLDPQGRLPGELLAAWHDFGRTIAEARDAAPGVQAALVSAAWTDERREILGLDCHFVREIRPPRQLPGGHGLRPAPHRLYEQVRLFRPDLLHVEGLVCPLEVRGLRRALPGVPILIQDHGSKVPRGWRRLVARAGFSSIQAAVFTARQQAEPFQAAGVLSPDVPVYEVIEGSSVFEPGDQAAARKETGLHGDPCLLWLGNLDWNKDPLTVLDAVARAAEALPALRLYMCYRSAALLDPVRECLRDPRLAGRVELLGEMPHARIEQLLRAADFLIQASHQEGSGFAVIEALACGTTPLVTAIPSFARITGGGTFGALVPMQDPAAMARAIVEWSGRDRAALRCAARAHFDRSLSFGAVGRELRSAWEQAARPR